MRALFGLAVPLLLLVASLSASVPQAAADVSYHKISGRVLSDAGVPLAGVQVSAYSYPEERVYAPDGGVRNAYAVTGEDGSFSLELAAGKGYVSAYFEKWRQSEGREFVLDKDIVVDLTLRTPPPKDARIEGRVVDGAGRPLANAEVSLQSRCCEAYPATDVAQPKPAVASSDNDTSASSGVVASSRPAVMPPYWEDYATTTSDADGRFSFEAYAGPRQVYAWAKGFAQSSVPVDAVANETVRVEVVLEKVPASDAVVVGRVVDAQTGAPVGRAQVGLRSLEWGRYAWAETDAGGNFRLTTVPGWAEISVSYYAYAEPMPVEGDGAIASKPLIMPVPSIQYYPYGALVKLESGENKVDAPIVPKPKPTIALIGYVVDPDSKKAVPGAHVSVWNHETGDWGEATTDATGSFKIMVRAGQYSGSAWKEGYLGGTQSFRVTGDATQRVDLIMPKGTTKWAPCYEGDDDCGGPIMYGRAEAGGASGAYADDTDEAKASTTGAPAPAPGIAPASGSGAALESGSSASEGGDRSQPATFSGSGGGLPPYDPDAPQEIPAGERAQTPGDAFTPGAGVLVALLAMLGAAAVVAWRRRG